MKYIQKHLFILLVIFLAIILRFYILGGNPSSLDWDEASTGYNAYSILHTGRDEYGNFLPLSIRSFDDYKPPVYTYLTVPSVAIFGLTPFAVRLPSAIFGILGVLLTYLLVFALAPSDKKQSKKVYWIAICSALFLSISPWHLQFSRTAFEANIGLTFLLAGFLTFLYGLRNTKWFFISSIFFVLSMYSYHSFVFIVPIFLLAGILLFRQHVFKNKAQFFLNAIVFLLLISPLCITFFSSTKGSASRLDMVSVFGSDTILKSSLQDLKYDQAHGDIVGEIIHNRRLIYIGAIFQGYLAQFNPDFLFFHGDGGLQHHAEDMGMLYIWDLPFLLFGLFRFCTSITRKTALLLLIFLIAPIPAAIATDPPHAVRAIAMLPALIIWNAVGFISSIYFLAKQNRIYAQIGAVIIAIGLVLNVVYYLHQYYVHTPIDYAVAWQYGTKEAIMYAKQHESEYDHIIVTYKYDQPYIYYLFYNHIDPTWYQQEWLIQSSKAYGRMYREIGKYTFEDIDWRHMNQMKNTLFIGTPDEIPADIKPDDMIYFPDGSEVFVITHT